MNICSKKDIKIITGIMAASMLLGGCTATAKPTELKNDPNVKAEINLNEVRNTEFDKELMDKEYRRYCFDIFSQTIRDYGKEDNIMISPASIMMAFDMVAAGAKGDTLKQLTDLFAAGQGPLTQQAYAASLMDKINGAKDVDFSCANAVWTNKELLGDAVNGDYIKYIQETFLAEYSVRTFDNKAVDEINDWVYDHTDHMIKKVVNNLNPDTVMVLVNAISFDGKWAVPYEEYQIEEGDFTKYDGSTQEVTFLNDNLSAYYETDKATGFIKAYEGGEYSFLAILPKDEKISANEFAKNFTAKDFEKFINSVSYDYDVHTKMPEFKSEFEFVMNGTIKNLGAGDVFDSSVADLSGIAGNPGDLFVSKVIHKTYIELDANGTKAAAVTAIMVDANGIAFDVPEVRYVECDRPFVYAIVDTESMTPIFIGTVNEV
ncbi:MAG: serpin family protein [Saccharofermentans sp.]|nr:serpin family protein [Saccharofermentans sp.]